ncbi:hypothetical protein ACEUZ9_002872 [Paracoccus litorisediminis]|uniref:hypothetical protein n=1 Tax=Paracoccus litorisediminis TaxID=2006130 RepID=UPI00372FB8E5
MLPRSLAFTLSLLLVMSSQPLFAGETPVHGKCATPKSELVPVANGVEWWLNAGQGSEAKVNVRDHLFDGRIVAHRPHGEGWKLNIRFTDNSFGETHEAEIAIFTVQNSFMMIGADFSDINGERVLHSVAKPVEILCIFE